jgi:hypothetical protein
MFAGYVVTRSRPYLETADAMSSHSTLEAGDYLLMMSAGGLGRSEENQWALRACFP